MKQVVKTYAIIERLKVAFGADVDVADMAVFETIALNNLPIRKKHPLYEGAVAQDSLLRELTARINAESVSLQLMHNTSELPSGRVFDARMNGQEVRALFGVSTKTQPTLVSDLDQGVIDQVSVNVLPKQILCSDCGWDYLGADATFDNIYLGTCLNDHKLGEAGVHAALHGLDLLAEISLVNTGGAQNARIQSRDKQIYAEPAFQRLAANGHSPAMLVADLTASIPQEDKTTMTDLTALTASLTDEKAKVITLTASLSTAELANATLTTAAVAAAVALTAANDELAALKANPPEAAPAVLAFVTDLCRRSLVATGEQNPVIPATIAEMITKTQEAQGKLSALIPAGGAALAAETDVADAKGAFASGAYSTAR
jgi:hypothetical protein